MSTSYFFFLEGKINGEWKNISPLYPAGDGRYIPAPIYWNGSWSAFGETHQELYNLSGAAPDHVSPEIHEWVKECYYEGEDENYSEVYKDMIMVPVSKIKTRLGDKSVYDHTAIASKESFQKYKAGELESPEMIDPAEYAKLPVLAQDLYQIGSWDDEYGWRRYFKFILQAVEYAVEFYENGPSEDEVTDVRLLIFIG